MSPDRAIVKRAIDEAKGNISKTAARLGCSRTTLYSWIYQLGLEKYAGICPDRRHELDSRECKDKRGAKTGSAPSHLFNQALPDAGSVPPVGATTSPAPSTTDLPVATTIRIPESLHRRIRIEAIREGLTFSQYAQRTFEQALAGPAAMPRPKRAGKS